MRICNECKLVVKINNKNVYQKNIQKVFVFEVNKSQQGKFMWNLCEVFVGSLSNSLPSANGYFSSY